MKGCQKLKKFRSFFIKQVLEASTTSSDPLEPFDLPLSLFKHFGWWITNQSSWSYIAYGITLRIFLIDAIILQQLVHLPSARNIVEITEIATVMVSLVNVFYESFVLYRNSARIKGIMEEIKSCAIDFEMDKKFYKRVVVIKKIWLATVGFSLYAVTVSIITCIAAHKPAIISWTPLDKENSVQFWLLLIYHYVCMLYISPTITTMQLLPAFFMTFIYGFLKQLCERLEKIGVRVDQEEKIDNRKELIKCVRFHVRIIEINRKVSELFSFVFLVRGLVTCLLICSTTFSLFAISDVSTVIQFTGYIVYVFVQLFVPCYYGSKIIEVSSNISYSIGHSEWMVENKEYRQLVGIILECVKKPMKISSFGLFDVDLINYRRVCRSAYSLFAVCVRLNN
jgi:hypothetical protein